MNSEVELINTIEFLDSRDAYVLVPFAQRLLLLVWSPCWHSVFPVCSQIPFVKQHTAQNACNANIPSSFNIALNVHLRTSKGAYKGSWKRHRVGVCIFYFLSLHSALKSNQIQFLFYSRLEENIPKDNKILTTLLQSLVQDSIETLICSHNVE